MAKQKKKYILVSLVLFFTAGSFFLFYPYRYTLLLEDPVDKELLAYLVLREGDYFQIKYTHSVHLSDVYEKYKTENGILYPVQLIYEDTAIGMPANAGEGETFEVKNGKYYISGLKGSHQAIDLAVGQVKANHTIILHDEHYLLENYVGAGTIIRITGGYKANWQLLEGRKMNE